MNRFLLREHYTPRNLFESVKGNLIFEGGTASVDDSVVNKPYQDSSQSAFVGYFWSGKRKRSVKGINLITLYYSDVAGNAYPVNFRTYDKQEGKTKNDYFLDMVPEIKQWGLKPAWVSGDSWYANLENLKFLKNEEVGFLFGVAHNRKVSLERGHEVQVQTLECPDSGLVVYLKEFGWVKVLRQDFKQARYYIMMLPALENLNQQESLKHLTRQTFKQVHDQHWHIESFHRVIKQVCNIEHCHVRNEQAIRNRVFCALQAFCRLQTMRVEGLIENLCAVARQLFIPVIQQFVLENLTNPVSG